MMLFSTIGLYDWFQFRCIFPYLLAVAGLSEALRTALLVTLKRRDNFNMKIG